MKSYEVIDEASIDALKQRKHTTKTKKDVYVEKIRKHIGKHSNISIAHPRTEELRWMLQHSPYIAEAGSYDKKHFIDTITNVH